MLSKLPFSATTVLKHLLSWAALLTLHAVGAESGTATSMPTYHFTSPTGKDCMPFDPNGAIYHRGRYHLGYIYQDEGKHYWGHASSADLLRWTVHPPMLSPGPEGGIFSGNAFRDKKGRVVVSYHGLGNSAMKVPGGNCLAVAVDDDLIHYRKLEANPVMKNPGWDPHTWLEGGTYYSISGSDPGSGRVASLYRSSDDTLARWELAGPLMKFDMPDVFANEDISCPDLFKLGGKHVLLCISHIRGARYYVGRFENEQFHPESHHRMNWPGGTFFAPETLIDAKGRRLLWAWVLGNPSTMSLPRELTMGDDLSLRIQPARELEGLRTAKQSLRAFDVAALSERALDGFQGTAKELNIDIDPREAGEFGVKVRRAPQGEEETVITCIPTRGVLRIETDKSSMDRKTRPRTYAMTFMLPKGAENPELSGQEAPFELKPGEPLRLRIFIDHSILEVFANGRQCLTQRIWPTRDDSTGVAVFSRSGAIRVRSAEAWNMQPTRFETPVAATGAGR